MMGELLKFVPVFIMVLIAALFSVAFIAGVDGYNDESGPDGFWGYGIFSGFIYIFETFVGAAQMSSFELDGVAVVFMLVGFVFGNLLLLNLLIALMASKYEEVKERATQDVIVNKTELSFDLMHRSRHMPLSTVYIIFCNFALKHQT